MATSFARVRRVRHRLHLAIWCALLLSGCGGGGDSHSARGQPAGTATDMVIALTWAPSPDRVDGYVVYSGATVDTISKRIADSLSPGIEFNAGRDLSLSYGQQVCFRVRAYVGGQESAPSEPACIELQQ